MLWSRLSNAAARTKATQRARRGDRRMPRGLAIPALAISTTRLGAMSVKRAPSQREFDSEPCDYAATWAKRPLSKSSLAWRISASLFIAHQITESFRWDYAPRYPIGDPRRGLWCYCPAAALGHGCPKQADRVEVPLAERLAERLIGSTRPDSPDPLGPDSEILRDLLDCASD